MSIVREHFAELAKVAGRAVDQLTLEVEALAERTIQLYRDGGKLVFCGNGGSAAEAQHLAAEYVVCSTKERGPRSAIALTTDTSVLTAAGNDLGYDAVFARQVGAIARPGDMLWLFSTSGESENLIRAAVEARDMGVYTVALLARGGGRLRSLVDHAIVVDTDSRARAQEIHLAIGHAVCEAVDEALVG